MPAMNVLSLIAALLMLVMTSGTLASDRSAEELYTAGVAALTKGDNKAAREFFQNAISANPDNPLTLYNLGLVEHRLNQTGLAIGYWRRALSVDPGLIEAKNALDWALEQLDRPESSSASGWNSFRNSTLVFVNLEGLILATILMSTFSAWISLKYAGRRRRALQDEASLPRFPTAAAILAAGSLLFIILSAAKVYDLLTPRATVVPSKVEVRSAPETESPALFELFEGHEVVVRQSKEQWVQVTIPGGMTGWVQRESIFLTSPLAFSL